MKPEFFLINPCPKCGVDLLTPPLNHVYDLVVSEIQAQGGKCPECHEAVLVSRDEQLRLGQLQHVKELTGESNVAVANLAIRNRKALLELGIRTFHDLVSHPQDAITLLLADYPQDIVDLNSIVDRLGLRWANGDRG